MMTLLLQMRLGSAVVLRRQWSVTRTPPSSVMFCRNLERRSFSGKSSRMTTTQRDSRAANTINSTGRQSPSDIYLFIYLFVEAFVGTVAR